MKIEEIPLFHGNDKSFYEEASKHLMLKKCSSKSIIFNEDDFLKSGSYILKSGIIVISKVNQFGAETLIGAKYPGELFGWSTSIDSGPTSGAATAITDSEYWFIPNLFIKDLLKNKYFTKNLLKYLMNYIRKNENFITNVHSTSALEKILIQILNISVPNASNDTFILHYSFNQGMISSFAGVSRETVSRVMKTLKLKKVFTLDEHKNIIINSTLAKKTLEKVKIA
jgi:CRP-like cAMP-binding protein